ncbi:group III truncated hemoglobin [Hymenobacter elongatus]|uniref:Group III truncated hemoglobin n=1 Tax=Hymenobacter elongatus TaxID=877208 RepID=A0A4Z0PLX2_9BACT|nr:group III truncated hemoglobin [Hymenobacter elongatus]TGE16601.1 group III truncated hemoglobin [Hymenobacter elongatus]
MPDITTATDLRLLVETFYAQVRQDDLLAPVFASRISPHTWPTHLDTMTRFWSAALLGQASGYRGNPGARHLALPIEAPHFARWLQLFTHAVDELFAGEKAEEVKLRAARMGEMFQAKIAMARQGRGIPLL